MSNIKFKLKMLNISLNSKFNMSNIEFKLEIYHVKYRVSFIIQMNIIFQYNLSHVVRIWGGGYWLCVIQWTKYPYQNELNLNVTAWNIYFYKSLYYLIFMFICMANTLEAYMFSRKSKIKKIFFCEFIINISAKCTRRCKSHYLKTF